MATLRQWLEEKKFDFENGTIVYQAIKQDNLYKPSPGWANGDQLEDGEIINVSHPILDEEFDSGYGGPECPRIFARDEEAIYFPGQYDGATWLEKININPGFYLKNKTPYPGG